MWPCLEAGSLQMSLVKMRSHWRSMNPYSSTGKIWTQIYTQGEHRMTKMASKAPEGERKAWGKSSLTPLLEGTNPADTSSSGTQPLEP